MMMMTMMMTLTVDVQLAHLVGHVAFAVGGGGSRTMHAALTTCFCAGCWRSTRRGDTLPLSTSRLEVVVDVDDIVALSTDSGTTMPDERSAGFSAWLSDLTFQSVCDMLSSFDGLSGVTGVNP